MTEADKAWLKELKDKTFSKWEPSDKHRIIVLVEAQEKIIEWHITAHKNQASLLAVAKSQG